MFATAIACCNSPLQKPTTTGVYFFARAFPKKKIEKIIVNPAELQTPLIRFFRFHTHTPSVPHT